GDLVAFGARPPDRAEPAGDLFLRQGETDVRAPGALAGRLVDGLRPRVQQEDAREEIGEGRTGLLRQRAAALPLGEVVGAVEGDDDVLRLLLDRPGEGRARQD